MILIADSGSTKCSWAICDLEGKKINEYKTIGFNPYFIKEEAILKELDSSKLNFIKEEVLYVFFYGAGCSAKHKNEIIEKPLAEFFKNAKIKVSHDLDAACFAMYNNQPNITCILGTGSNSCYFDGQNIKENGPSLGFIMGDEASGNHFGKKLLTLYFNKLFPTVLAKNFEKNYEHDIHKINDKVYKSSRANVFLASYFPFICENKNHPVIKKIINETLNEFINLHIKCFSNYKNIEVNFIGSVSYFLSNEIQTLAKENEFKVGQILQNPIDKLINYHANKIAKEKLKI
tara:strand:+ start:74 stop:940 length:867 start_codon:yes stop_codon:yes gene_type:complete